METEKEIKELEEDLGNLDVKELSKKTRTILFLVIIGVILFSLWWEFWR